MSRTDPLPQPGTSPTPSREQILACGGGKIRPQHLNRLAIVYVRQSTQQQVLNNCESAERQYALKERAIQLGWPAERVVIVGREIYSWHPNGIARSKLATALSGKLGGVTTTARNWRTVTTLLEMAQDGD